MKKQAIDRRSNIIDKKINANLPTIKDLNEHKRKADQLDKEQLEVFAKYVKDTVIETEYNALN